MASNTMTIGAQKYLDRILEMHNSGHTSGKIAYRILTLDMETVEFCLEAMVEIIIKYAENEKECKIT